MAPGSSPGNGTKPGKVNPLAVFMSAAYAGREANPTGSQAAIFKIAVIV